MEYEVFLLESAHRDFLNLPMWLQGVVERHLERLGRSPRSYSRRSITPPHPPSFMWSELIHGPIDGKTHHISIFFRYSQDETKLIVHWIGYQSVLG
jgi:hypothetical protein